MKNPLGILEGRLTPTMERGMQFFPDRDGEWEREFTVARTIGLDCIELLIERREDFYNPVHPLNNREALRHLVEETGVQVHSVHGFFGWHAEMIAELQRLIRAAVHIKARMVLLPFFDEQVITTETAQRKAFELLKPCIKEAAKLGICFGIETELPAEQVVDFIDRFDTPHTLGVAYDIGNAYALGYPVAKEIQWLGKRIVGVHVKDRLRLNGTPGKSVPLGIGSANLPEALASLKKVHYTGPIILQGARQEGVPDKKVVAGYATLVRNLLEKGD